MKDFIKNIIIEKKYFELTRSEKKRIDLWASNEEEYNVLRSVMITSQSIAAKNETELSPSIKQRLDERFAAKHALQNEKVRNKFLVFFFPRNTHFFKKPAFQLAMVALIIALVIPFLWQDSPAQYAMNEDKKSVEIEKNKTQKTKEQEVKVDKLDDQLKSEIKIPEISEKASLMELSLSDEYVLDKIESVSTADSEKSIDFNQTRSRVEMIKPVEVEMDNLEVTEEVYSADAKSLSSPEMPKKLVKTNETINLLMALY